ncbi:MAG: rod shape-determining protein MreD [Thermodesulfovibrio sp.]|nr:rod shape-determining protein MreD [Thermodesulfovibrio sp.]
MRYAAWLLAAFCALLLQGRVSVLGIVPNLTVLLAFYAGIRYGANQGLLAGLLIGFVEDSLSGSLIGPNMLAKGLVGYVAAFFITGGLFRWTPLLGVFSVSALTLAGNIVTVLAKTLFDKMPGSIASIIFISVMQALLNAMAGAFMRPEHAD